MWCPLFLVLLAGAASAEHFQAWKTDTEYDYLVRGRSLTGIHDLSDQYAGMIYKATLTVHPKSEDTLQAKLSKAQYARIHTKLPEGWKSDIPDSMVDWKQLPMTDKVFEIKMKHGVVRDLIVDKDVPTWEVNMLKSIVSQLQVDTQGENLMPSKYNQEPDENRVNAMYKTMEDSVGGRCEVLYDISPVPVVAVWNKPEWSVKPELRGDGEIIDILKTKNYTNCEQRMSHHFGITGASSAELFNSENNKFMSRSTISRVIITGDLKTFTIQSSVTTDKVIVSPNSMDSEKGMVGSRVNVTLVRMGPVSSGPWSDPANAESTGNLVYNYNNPFAGPGEDRRPGKSSTGPGDPNSNERVRVTDDRSMEDDSSASQPSSRVDSLESNEQQKSYWQPKPTLNEPPSSPLLPFFIGNHGKSIQKTPEIDSVVTAKSLASQIGSDLQNPSALTDEQTLEKFTILSRVLRTMDTQQIAEAERDLYQSANEIDPHDEGQSVRRSTWIAFRDAVAHAGTGPALVTIKKWLKEKKVEGAEAASVVGVLSKSARTPTPEYMDAFFEMVTMPETTSQDILNSTAMITFAELIRYSQVNHATAHNRYPVHSFGRLSPKHNPAIFRDWIPYMAEELKKAFENDEAAKSHAFIRALGAVAHPKILAVFEPYLEGQSKASTFQRLMMVMSLNKLASLRPRLVRGVLYRIYQNTGEAHQLRCAAVSMIMSTDPPASMLQRMAEFTNYDHSKQVNAAVRSSIESASELERPEARSLAAKARNVLSLLNKETYGMEYSDNYLVDDADEHSLTSRVHMVKIDSTKSFIPEAVYASFERMHGGLRIPRTEAGAMVSSIKDWFEAVQDMFAEGGRGKSDESEISPEKIAKLLKLENQETDEFEAALWMNNPYENKFVSFDKGSLRRVPDLIRKVVETVENGHNFNTAKINDWDVTLSFPMESGLPFIYTLKAPSLLKLSGSIKTDSDSAIITGDLDVRVIHAAQLQTRLGFVAPFENQHYMSGVYQNYQLYLPIRAKLEVNTPEKRATLKLEPINQSEGFKIVESSTIPFTSRRDVLSMSPVMKDKETHKLLAGEILTVESVDGDPSNRLNIKEKFERDVLSPSHAEETIWKQDLMSKLPFFMKKEKLEYRKTELFLVPNDSKSQSIILTAAYETLRDDSAKHRTKKDEKLRAKAPEVKSTKLEDPGRKKQLLKEAVAGIVAADALAVDLGVTFPGPERDELFMTVAYADSKADEKSRGSIYVRRNEGAFSSEMCAGIESLSPKSSMFDREINENAENRPTQYDAEIRMGQTCKDGIAIRVHGNQTLSEDNKESIKKLPSMSKCLKEMKESGRSLEACQDISAKLSFMDQADLLIEFDPSARNVKEDIDRYIMSMSSDLDHASLMTQSRKDLNEDSSLVTMIMDPSKETATFYYQTSDATVAIPDVNMGSLGNMIGNVDPDISLENSIDMNPGELNPDRRDCVIDTKSAMTFDHKTYPARFGKCWHVAMTSHPTKKEGSSSEKKIREDKRVSILVRDGEKDAKDVRMALGNTDLMMAKVEGKIKVTVDGKPIDLTDEKPVHKQKDSDDPEFEIVRRADGSVRLHSSKYDIDTIYDGEYVRIKASDAYRGEVRGLCGNYDSEPANDFISPKNCVLKDPDVFVGSYALTTKDCQGPSLDLSKRADEAECSREIIRPGNVISDREAGRKDSGKSSWGWHNKKSSDDDKSDKAEHKRCTMVRTKVIEEADQMCFSMRPVPACAPGCTASRTKPKVMPMHCMPKDPAGKEMADRIKQGANPDLSQKEYTKKSGFDLPVSCHAA